MSTVDFNLSCAKCSASLQGLSLDGKCRVCKTPVEACINVSIVDSDTLVIDKDLNCRICGYNLRALHAGAQCPECSTKVTQSVAANHLWFADTKWLRRVNLAVCLMLIAAVFTVILIAVFIATHSDWSDKVSTTMITGVIVAYILTSMAAIGITTKEPCGVKFCQSSRLRFLARVSIGVPLVIMALSGVGRSWNLGWLIALSSVPLVYLLALINVAYLVKQHHNKMLYWCMKSTIYCFITGCVFFFIWLGINQAMVPSLVLTNWSIADFIQLSGSALTGFPFIVGYILSFGALGLFYLYNRRILFRNITGNCGEIRK